MDLNAAFFLRLVASLSVVGLADIVRSRRMPAFTWNEKAFSAFPESLQRALLAVALAMVPAVDPLLLGSLGPSSLLGIWALLWLALGVSAMAQGDTSLDALSRRGPWIIAWGLGLAASLSFFGQQDLDRIGDIQEKLWGSIVPKWGVTVSPLGFVVALYALVRWWREEINPAFSLQTSAGLLNALFLSTTVCVFLGGWQVPWLGTPALSEAMSHSWWALVAVQGLIFSLKLGILAAGLSGLAKWQWLTDFPMTPHRWCAFGAANLLLTWAILSWRGA